MAAALDSEIDPVAPSDRFRVDHHTSDFVELRQPIARKLEAQYRRWQDHDQHLWREAINSPRTVVFLGLDPLRTLDRLRKYDAGSSMRLSLLSDLQLCTIPPAIVDAYERGYSNATKSLHGQYQQYSVQIYDFGQQSYQYCVPLLDLTVVIGEEPLLFCQRAPEDASCLLPQQRNTCRLIVFPQTRYSFLEDEIFHSIYPLREEQFKTMSCNLLPCFRGTMGYYNSFPSLSTNRISQRSPNEKDIAYLATVYPIIHLESLTRYESRKTSERDISFMQQHGRTGLPAIAQARYSRRFDFPEEIRSCAGNSSGCDHTERVQSGRALYEYAYGEVDTMALDKHQISVLEGLERDKSQPSQVLVIEPLWLLAFPTSDLLCVFRNETGDSAGTNAYKDVMNKSSNSPQNWAKTLIQIVGNADSCIGRYEPTYRTWLAKLRIRVQTTERLDQSLVKRFSDFVAEVAILLEPLQNQIEILQYWRHYIGESTSEDKAILQMYDEAIKAREVHLGSLQRLLDQGKNTQALLFQLSNTETAYLQSNLATSMAHETRAQTDLAERAQRQNQSILIFTIITVIFLPLSFFTSYFGMNTRDIRATNASQWVFWAFAAPISVFIISFASFWAFRRSIGHWYRKLCRDEILEQEEDGISEYKEP